MFIDSAPPISSEYASNFAPVPDATTCFLFIFAVNESEPVISSLLWKTPVSVWLLLIINLLSVLSILTIVAVAFDTVPVTVSPTWKPLTESKYK